MIELGMVLLLIAVVIGIFVILRSLRTFLVNARIGLFVLYLANAAAGLGIGYDWSVVLICAFGGALGALMVIALHIMGWAF
ncbi:pro-sigmaK processing inhibitor BofA family protein [Methanothrix sp.]|uniref:pro-sigmaK processing inhibitor BofA family protein n=1 Tax=Methanothrix sp. TaxID=90426 RepID=UPI0034E1C514